MKRKAILLIVRTCYRQTNPEKFRVAQKLESRGPGIDPFRASGPKWGRKWPKNGLWPHLKNGGKMVRKMRMIFGRMVTPSQDVPFFGNPLTIYRVLSALGPETPKKSEESLVGALAPESPRESCKSLEKVWKRSRKGPEKTSSRLFPDSRGASAPGRLFFQTFWPRETPVNGQRVPKPFLELRIFKSATHHIRGCS